MRVQGESRDLPIPLPGKNSANTDSQFRWQLDRQDICTQWIKGRVPDALLTPPSPSWPFLYLSFLTQVAALLPHVDGLPLLKGPSPAISAGCGYPTTEWVTYNISLIGLVGPASEAKSVSVPFTS